MHLATTEEGRVCGAAERFGLLLIMMCTYHFTLEPGSRYTVRVNTLAPRRRHSSAFVVPSSSLSLRAQVQKTCGLIGMSEDPQRPEFHIYSRKHHYKSVSTQKEKLERWQGWEGGGEKKEFHLQKVIMSLNTIWMPSAAAQLSQRKTSSQTGSSLDNTTPTMEKDWAPQQRVDRSWTESRRKMQRQRERNHLTNHVKRQTRVISIVYYLLDPLSSGTIGYQWWSTTVIWRGWSQWPPGQHSWWCLRSISHLLNGVNEGMFLSDLVELCSTKDVEEHTKTCFDHQQLVGAQSSIQHSIKQHTITFIIHQHSHAPMTTT